MKYREVIMRAMAKKDVLGVQAGEKIIGLCERQMRSLERTRSGGGYDGLLIDGRGKTSPKRVPVTTVEEVLACIRRSTPISMYGTFTRSCVGTPYPVELHLVKRALQMAGL